MLAQLLCAPCVGPSVSTAPRSATAPHVHLCRQSRSPPCGILARYFDSDPHSPSGGYTARQTRNPSRTRQSSTRAKAEKLAATRRAPSAKCALGHSAAIFVFIFNVRFASKADLSAKSVTQRRDRQHWASERLADISEPVSAFANQVSNPRNPDIKNRPWRLTPQLAPFPSE
jgi:hypothetical protein